MDPESFQQAVTFLEGIPLEWANRDEDVDMEDTERVEPEVEKESDGEVTLTYRGSRDQDGVALAVIGIEAEVEIEQFTSHEQDHGHGTSITESESLQTVVHAGELLWDVEHGHLHRLELESEFEAEGIHESVFEFGGQEHESVTELETFGGSTLTVTFERVE